MSTWLLLVMPLRCLQTGARCGRRQLARVLEEMALSARCEKSAVGALQSAQTRPLRQQRPRQCHPRHWQQTAHAALADRLQQTMQPRAHAQVPETTPASPLTHLLRPRCRLVCLGLCCRCCCAPLQPARAAAGDQTTPPRRTPSPTRLGHRSCRCCCPIPSPTKSRHLHWHRHHWHHWWRRCSQLP